VLQHKTIEFALLHVHVWLLEHHFSFQLCAVIFAHVASFLFFIYCLPFCFYCE